jgi:hypothetical protein
MRERGEAMDFLAIGVAALCIGATVAFVAMVERLR